MELISSALRDLSEAEFVGRRDSQNNPLPSPFEPLDRNLGSARLRFNPLQPSGKVRGDMPLTPALRDWTRRNVLSAGSLLGKSCQGALLLAGHGEQLQKQGFLFGKHLSLAWQVNHLWLEHDHRPKIIYYVLPREDVTSACATYRIMYCPRTLSYGKQYCVNEIFFKFTITATSSKIKT